MAGKGKPISWTPSMEADLRRLFAGGSTLKQIGAHFDFSEQGVKNHVARLGLKRAPVNQKAAVLLRMKGASPERQALGEAVLGIEHPVTMAALAEAQDRLRRRYWPPA